MVQRAFSIVLLAVSLQLMKRRRAAWYITIFILLLNFIRGFSEFRHPARLVIMAVDLVLFIIFVCFREDFCCPSSKRSKKAAAVFLLLSLAGIAANAGLSYHYMKLGSPDNAGSLWDSLVSGTGMILEWETVCRECTAKQNMRWQFSGSAGDASWRPSPMRPNRGSSHAEAEIRYPACQDTP